jgi:two-component system response regulator AtoC
MPTILIVDDDDAVRGVLYEVLSEKYECHTASTTDEALQYLEVERYDAILTDIAMPGLDGISLLKQVQFRDPTTPVILISGKGSEQDWKKWSELGAFAFVTKPFSLEEIEEIIARALPQEEG